MNIHDKIAKNIIDFLDTSKIEFEKGNKIEVYALFLTIKTKISYKRLKKILTIGAERKITLIELIAIADGLNLPIEYLIKK